MRPEPHRAVPRLGGDRPHEHPAQALPAVGRVDDELAAAGFRGIGGRVQMGEAGQVAVPPEQQVAGAIVTAVPDVQHGLLRQRPDAVRGRRGGREPQHGLRFGRADPATHGDGSRAAGAAIAAGVASRLVFSGPLVQGWIPRFHLAGR